MKGNSCSVVGSDSVGALGRRYGRPHTDIARALQQGKQGFFANSALDDGVRWLAGQLCVGIGACEVGWVSPQRPIARLGQEQQRTRGELAGYDRVSP
jgi:hypothetical protein